MKQFVVMCDLDNEIKVYCEEHNIEVKEDGKYLTFSGLANDLEELHNKFFEEYDFELE